jgi:uncharacterized protein YbjT (DUF2867 family)
VEILLTGITGAVGSQLAPALVADGHRVRGLSRRPSATLPDGVEAVQGDAVSGAGLAEALRGIEVAYYLIHSMESIGAHAGNDFAAAERRSAENFANAASEAGVRRTVYLGGLVPETGHPSAHLASRLAVEERLMSATPEAIAFRASIVIGAASRSFRFLVRLVERMPILLIPAWRDHVTAPIDDRDVTAYLASAATVSGIERTSWDIAGPEVLSYQALIERIRDLLMLPRPVLRIPHLTVTPIAARVSAVIAGEDPGLIEPLMEGLDEDLLPRAGHAPDALAVRRHTLDAAIEHALREWESVERLRAR